MITRTPFYYLGVDFPTTQDICYTELSGRNSFVWFGRPHKVLSVNRPITHTWIVWEVICQLHTHICYTKLVTKESFPNYLRNHFGPHSRGSWKWFCEKGREPCADGLCFWSQLPWHLPKLSPNSLLGVQSLGFFLLIQTLPELSGPLNRLNAILSLLQPLDRYRTPSAIGSAIETPYLALSHS